MTFAVSEFASRPVQTTSALKIAFVILGATVALAGAKAVMATGFTAQSVAAPLAPTEAVVAVAEPATFAGAEAAQSVCRRVDVEIDEGYGVRGQVTRWVCRKAY
ncbi:hypothetical protein IY145_08425 [Methylosinus sp. H3A]|uniref:hypothetical protein n=1 Tax=Methylosinus sp. H3A TaxID=2785786 RepID=UPI0018C26043|nr:hypothetical protein [Methylosinus sp. H3A]MBG0809402.1 hypothetical protein [Methylosinus sp. H3A]